MSYRKKCASAITWPSCCYMVQITWEKSDHFWGSYVSVHLQPCVSLQRWFIFKQKMSQWTNEWMNSLGFGSVFLTFTAYSILELASVDQWVPSFSWHVVPISDKDIKTSGAQSYLAFLSFYIPNMEKEMETHSRVLAWTIPGMGWNLAWRILSITLLSCEMSAIVWKFEHSLVRRASERGAWHRDEIRAQI